MADRTSELAAAPIENYRRSLSRIASVRSRSALSLMNPAASLWS